MPGTERVREQLPQGLSSDYVEQRERRGWSLVAVEWERPASEVPTATLRRTEVPYGLQVSEDFLHLEENTLEVETMVKMGGSPSRITAILVSEVLGVLVTSVVLAGILTLLTAVSARRLCAPSSCRDTRVRRMPCV